MLTHLTIRNFKRFAEVEIELGNPVVFIGPNNSGKTTALQALTLWDLGLRKWNEKRQGQTPEKRPGVTINRRDLLALPVPNANHLWRDLHVRSTRQISEEKKETQNVRIEIIVEGVTEGEAWRCGLELDYANEESFYCKPLRLSEAKTPERMPVPLQAGKTRIAFLPPMSGLSAVETRLDPGAINVRLGEGRTAEVLRNLCYQIAFAPHDGWIDLQARIRHLFGVELEKPQLVSERGELEMKYRDPSGGRLDLSASGRGLQQTLLVLAYLTINPGAVLLIDEPDAHLEILRQRQIYKMLGDTAVERQSQVILASHSEVILNEAADRDVVVAFVGKPHRIDDRSHGSQVLKSLKEIGFDQYYQAEQTGWVLYLEGSTDLAILQAFSLILDHPSQGALERPFVHYVENQPGKARDHFFGLREARSDLQAFALFDRLNLDLEPNPYLVQYMWRRREIETYLCSPETLVGWAREEAARQLGPLFREAWVETMEAAMRQVETAMATLGKGSPWSPDTKVSSDFLDPLFELFFKTLRLPNLMRKTDYHTLARCVPREQIDPEVMEVLDKIVAVRNRARPQY